MNVFGFDLAIDGAELTILIEVAEDKIVLADKVKSAAIAIETENSSGSLVGQVGTGGYPVRRDQNNPGSLSSF